MNDAKGRKARRRVFLPEMLEGRLLLSSKTVARPAITGVLRSLGRPYAPPIASLQGRVSGTRASDGLYGGTLPGQDSYSGHGTSSLGDVLFGTSFYTGRGATLADPSSIEQGSAVFRVGYNGEQIHVRFSGESAMRVPGRTSWRLVGELAGGTGRFEGASGPFSGTLTTLGGPAGVNGSFTLNYALRFDTPV